MLALIGGFEWFQKGGWAMYPLLVLSVWTIFVIFERWIYHSTVLKRIERDLESVLRGGAPLPERLEGELPPLLARSLKEGELSLSRAELAVEHEVLSAARYTESLDAISQVGPMFGLLGTVSGMIRVFQLIASQKTAVDPSVLAGGIWEVLLATAFGLLVGILGFLSFRTFRSRLTHWENRLHTAVEDVQHILANQGGRTAAPAPGAAERP